MTIANRIKAFDILFEMLQDTTSSNEKKFIVKVFKDANKDLVPDLEYIFETLNNMHPIGWTFTPASPSVHTAVPDDFTIKRAIQFLENAPDHSLGTTTRRESDLGYELGVFLEPIVNRTLRLGIRENKVRKADLAPMLAKKYEGKFFRNSVAVTEKLDGNRCIAHFDIDTQKWVYTSRSGKPLNVEFDMSGMDTACIYDGEVMSVEQTLLSIKRNDTIINGTQWSDDIDMQSAQLMFNQTSGLINRKGTKSGLVYNIFDVVDDDAYADRRSTLTRASEQNVSSDVRILPIMYMGNSNDSVEGLLYNITSMGGEGIMLNDIHAGYEHKRSGSLLKAKLVNSMDMEVVGTTAGTGKYTGMVGALVCELITADGKLVRCEVGTGLSDDQRLTWKLHPESIVGRIVQVGYHELTQQKDLIGSDYYSLRFPRLVCVRRDKNQTSEF